jgi:hypothetical protein
MSRFGFYSKLDITHKEALMITGKYDDKDQATKAFAIIKKLPVDTFLSLYEVVQL